jgi:hypothetical protein
MFSSGECTNILFNPKWILDVAFNDQDRPSENQSLSTEVKIVFENYLPVHNCPPLSAKREPIALYRLITLNKPSADDFMTAHERGVYIDFDPCIRCSLSSYRDMADAEKLRKRVPHFRKHAICYGTVPTEAGAHLATPSRNEKSHHSWWPALGIMRHSYFVAVL